MNEREYGVDTTPTPSAEVPAETPRYDRVEKGDDLDDD